MKNAYVLAFIAFTLTHLVHADNIPKEPERLKGSSVRALEVLTHLADDNNIDFEEFAASGNQITNATVQTVSPGITRFTFVNRRLAIDNRTGVGMRSYLGGATLVVTQQRLGADFEYTTMLNKIK